VAWERTDERTPVSLQPGLAVIGSIPFGHSKGLPEQSSASWTIRSFFGDRETMNYVARASGE
jgi:hypothetical protein